MTRQLTWGVHDWYVTFEDMPKLAALIPRKSENTAGSMALRYGTQVGSKAVVLRKMKRGTKV